ncbi:Ferritin; heavy subunit [Camelus dromedarius]|uniref:Ferritin n=1 Tax=Camelus dromedarius TaxID=9838 RepID=A0A5N4EKW0_CAMDR|nr:Ferritin; heavy subunit [Camelus dromedarius]
MESKAEGLLPEECRVALNQVASYELNVSDAYVSMTCYYTEDKETPAFLTFFEDQAERLDIENWGTGKKAIESALQLENTLSSLLQDLKALASRKKQASLARFMKKFLDEQIRNISYLEYQLGYQEELEKMAKNEGQDEKAAVASEASGKETPEGNTARLPTQQVPSPES